MNFLSGQDDFFRTGNQPISVRHLSQPYNNKHYEAVSRKSRKTNNDFLNIIGVSTWQNVLQSELDISNFVLAKYIYN